MILKITENNMRPIFYKGDMVYFKKVLYKDLKVGDIIVFKTNNISIARRIVFFQPFKRFPVLITKGDNSQFPDKPIKPHQILGKAYQVKRGFLTIRLDYIYSLQASNYLQEIEKINSCLNSLGIHYVFLKGVIYSLYYVKMAPQRIINDSDILINPDDLEMVREVFIKLGYRETLINPKQIQKLPEIEYFKKVGGLNITFDVHLDAFFLMFNSYKSPVFDYSLLTKFSQELITNRRFILIDQLRLPILPLNYLFVYLTLDIFHHNFKGYHKFEFIHQIVKNKKIKYIAVLNMAKGYQFENFIYPVLNVLINYYRSPIPLNLLDSLKPSKVCLFFTKWFLNLRFILASEPRTREAATRFLLIMLLSPRSIFIKLYSVFTCNTLLSIYLHIYEIFRLFFKKAHLQMRNLIHFLAVVFS